MVTKKQKRAEKKLKTSRKQKKKYPEILDEVIEQSDIILEVLDARFPEDTSNPTIEKQILKKKKLLIKVLNKADISETKPQTKPNQIEVSCTERKNIVRLRNLLKQLSKKIKKPEEGKVIVGVIGYPNTGKSTLINCLAGRASAGTGPTAGFTKGIQKIRLSSEIHLLDCPGVISKEDYSTTDAILIAKHAKTSARDYNKINDPDITINELWKKYSEQIQKAYKLEAKNSEEFIEKLGRKNNTLKKGNQVNDDQVARKILKDWQEGLIRI